MIVNRPSLSHHHTLSSQCSGTSSLQTPHDYEAFFLCHMQQLHQHVFDGCMLVKIAVMLPNMVPPLLLILDKVYIDSA